MIFANFLPNGKVDRDSTFQTRDICGTRGARAKNGTFTERYINISNILRNFSPVACI